MVSPSDMMDGRVAAIRDALDAEGFTEVRTAALSKPASNLPEVGPCCSSPVQPDTTILQTWVGIRPRDVCPVIGVHHGVHGQVRVSFLWTLPGRTRLGSTARHVSACRATHSSEYCAAG